MTTSTITHTTTVFSYIPTTLTITPTSTLSSPTSLQPWPSYPLPHCLLLHPYNLDHHTRTNLITNNTLYMTAIFNFNLYGHTLNQTVSSSDPVSLPQTDKCVTSHYILLWYLETRSIPFTKVHRLLTHWPSRWSVTQYLRSVESWRNTGINVITDSHDNRWHTDHLLHTSYMYLVLVNSVSSLALRKMDRPMDMKQRRESQGWLRDLGWTAPSKRKVCSYIIGINIVHSHCQSP